MPTITALYAALLTVLVVVLALRVALYRMRHRIGVGDGGDARLLRRVRAHGNAIEWIPLGLLLLLLLELSGVAGVWLHAAGAGLVLARLLHAVGIGRSTGASLGRAVGTVLSVVVLLAMAVALLWTALPIG